MSELWPQAEAKDVELSATMCTASAPPGPIRSRKSGKPCADWSEVKMSSKEPLQFKPRPASPNEAGIFYALPPEKDEKKRQSGQLVGRVTFTSGERLEFTDPEEYLQTVREELPFHATTGFRFETLTSDPEIRKAVDDALYDLYGEENPRQLEDYQERPDQGMTMGGM